MSAAFLTTDRCGRLINANMDDKIKTGEAIFKVNGLRGEVISYHIGEDEHEFTFGGATYWVDRMNDEVVNVRKAVFPAEPVREMVNHPKHYNSHPSGVECIDVIETMPFNLGNCVKYLWRAGIKDASTHVEDLKKAAWYLNREIERVEKSNGA